MAFRSVRYRANRYTPKLNKVEQRFNYLLVIDFEATCEKDLLLSPQEIIEFPCVALSTQDWSVKNVFHEYVKPKRHPTLTVFCTELTGILQETVEDRPFFPEVFSKFCAWLAEGNYSIDNSAFVTCGDWDLRFMLPSQCALDGIPVPDHFKQWIDLKRSYCDTTQYFPRSLKDMLIRMNLPPMGRLHSGIHDAQNMVRVIQALNAKHKAEFKITSKLDFRVNNSELQ